ncbi:MAG: hypothetical protein KatS3mg119_2087 [Rhodothalassiaceae bacterium]|nr:MAG: hypothetical protein KatS3mg119_2087 [Rhodothalassiaceae bacterium]
MSEEQRLDQWLAVARFFKSRSLAARMVRMGRVRMGGEPLRKPARALRIGEVLTITRAHEVVVVRVTGFAPRRLSPALARGLYEILAREETPRSPPAPRPPRRPDGRARRRLRAWKEQG